MNLIRWEPLREISDLRRSLDRLFDETLIRPFWATEELSAFVPPIDMIEKDNEVVVKAMIPGVTEDDIKVDIVGDTLTIKGESKTEKEDKRENYYYRECRYGAFSRSLRLPSGLKTDKVEAEMENGVLTVTIPKAEAVKPKTIKVKAKKSEKEAKEAGK